MDDIDAKGIIRTTRSWRARRLLLLMRPSDQAFREMMQHSIRCVLTVDLLDDNLWAIVVAVAQDQFVPREAVSKEGCLTYPPKKRKKDSSQIKIFLFTDIPK